MKVFLCRVDLLNIISKLLLKIKYYSAVIDKIYQNRTLIDFRIMLCKFVVLHEIQRENWKFPNTFDNSYIYSTRCEHPIYFTTLSTTAPLHIDIFTAIFQLYIYIYIGSGCSRVVQGAGRKAKRMVLQCINGVGSNPVEGRTKI